MDRAPPPPELCSVWNDDRGAAGILASSAIYLRYRSITSNYSRSRANAISRSLLCDDFSDSDIHIDTSVNLSDPAIVAAFIVNWCRACHSIEIPAGMRQQAPLDVNFDTIEDIRAWSSRIGATAGSGAPSMPPTGGPSASERAMLVEWLRCGAP